MFYYTGNFGKKQTKNARLTVLHALSAALFALPLFMLSAALCFALVAAGGCAVQELSSLRAFSGTHTGVYVCEYAQWNGEDLLARYDRITLELCADGTCRLLAASEEGDVSSEGTYAFDEQAQVLVLKGAFAGKTFTKRCVYRGGAFTLQHTSPGMRFAARFRLLP